MIFSTIDVDYHQFGYPAAIVRALDFLKNTDVTALAGGRHNLEGEAGVLMYANVDDVRTRSWEEAKPESHKRYIDIQFMVKGEEEIGYFNHRGDVVPTESYPDRDAYFYDIEEIDEGRLHLREGSYAIFYPTDVHRTLLAVKESVAIRKVVVKVNLDLIND